MTPPREPGLVFDAEVALGAGPAFVLAARVAVDPGEVVALLGPNGAGKTTLLRAIAGLAPVSTGSIRIGARVVDDGATRFVPVEDRGVGVVFQDYRLFPAMSVRDNVAFGLRARGVSRDSSRRTADAWLERFGMTPLADRRPGRLSGGQAQRVAMARALASEPRVLLLDEPLSALDVHVRGEVREELRRFVRAFAGPVVLVTHDPVEALVLADRIVVLEAGRVVQDADPATITRRPATSYVAKLVGLNHYTGRYDPATGAVALDQGGSLLLADAPAAGVISLLVALRPSAISIHTTRPDHASPRNLWPGIVRSVERVGDRVRLDVDGEPPAVVDLTPAAVAELGLRPGREVWLGAKATEIEAYE